MHREALLSRTERKKKSSVDKSSGTDKVIQAKKSICHYFLCFLLGDLYDAFANKPTFHAKFPACAGAALPAAKHSEYKQG